MLDQRTIALLNVINAQCQGGGYKIFGIDELTLAMPKNFYLTAEEVNESLSILESREYISVKYQDDVEICLRPLSKGRLETESRIDGEIDRLRLERKYFLFAFLGGLLGGIFTFLIALALRFFGGV